MVVVLTQALAYDIQFACGDHMAELRKITQLLSALRGQAAMLLLGVSLVVGAQQAGSQWALKPYRVLRVVDKWEDPASQVITSERDSFQPVAALLKAWSVAFEILRLDQQTLGASPLFERTRAMRYGAVLWLADGASHIGKNVAALEEASQGGTSVLVLGSRCQDPALERVLGLKFKEPYSSTDTLETGPPHVITLKIVSLLDGAQ